ncbi:MAG: hypothetical protein B6D62_00070 [Candidatus Cloacimonas sp. 4484_275]|nr:MAG: hypothetical protein B6D62_00070 [Candidatus Cloacimonas sp. 4484_275]RLC52150.1 MAG: hypothetical protein DRZ79_01625 [Candidatus Cloacimonadota bacterium]
MEKLVINTKAQEKVQDPRDELLDDLDEELFVSLEDESSESRRMGTSTHLRFDVMLPYADLMTLLLVFFVFFFIISDFNKAKKIIEHNEKTISETKLDSLLKLNEQVITIPGEILFESGKADLNWESKKVLAKVAQEIKNKIGDDPAWQIRIEGHTDNVPIINGKYSSNWELSTARALRIVKFFMVNNYFPPDQLQAMGYGEFKPIVPNDTPENRKKNRRVEIKLWKKFNSRSNTLPEQK